MKTLKQTQEKGQLIIALFQISSRLLQLCILYRKEKQQLSLTLGLNDEYVEGIFVFGEMQSQGIGKILLNYAKDKRNKLYLNVYQKNARAISFYKREGFEIQHSGLDEATGEKDYVMTWQHKQKFQFGYKIGFINDAEIWLLMLK